MTVQKSCTRLGKKSYNKTKPHVLQKVKMGKGGVGVIESINPVSQAEVTASIRLYFLQLQADELQPLTINKYHQCLRTYQEWLGDQPVSEQTAKQFIGFLRQQGFKQTTVRIYYHALKPFLEFLGIPLRLKFHRSQKLPVYYSPDDVRAILRVILQRQDRWSKLAPRDNAMILTLAYTGIRRGELLALRVRDINFQNNFIRVMGKGKKERVIPMVETLSLTLRDYSREMEPGDFLFPLQPRRVWAIVVGYAKQAGLPGIHPHCFRHYFATQLVESGERLEVVKELLGHADISTTEIYTHVTAQHLSAAVSKLPNITEQRLDGMET